MGNEAERKGCRDMKRKTFAAAGVLLCCMIVIPLFNQGIMCGDELATRFYRMHGIGQFLKSVFAEQIEKGRALSAVTLPIASGLGFLSSRGYLFRIMQVLSLFLDIGLFSYLLYKLKKDRWFSLFTAVCLAAFMPVSFENTAPNAFCTLFNIPFAILLLSFLWYVDFIDGRGKKYLTGSMACLFVAEMCYETFIAFTPIFLFLLLYRLDIRREFQKTVRYLSVPFVVSCVYLVLYAVCSKIFVSNYAGNQFGSFDAAGSFQIILHLFKASFPGFYVWGSPKYKFLLNFYKDFSAGELFRILILVVVFCFLLTALFREKEKENQWFSARTILILFGGCICIVLPSLPIAVAQMYQGNVGENGFVALPVTWFSYFFAVFVMCRLIWPLIQNRWVRLLIVPGFCVLLAGVQYSNGVFSQEQNRNFRRLTEMEACLKTDLFKSFGDAEFASLDMFETMNSMAFYDSYWTQFSNLFGSAVSIENREPTQQENRIYVREGRMYVWYDGDLYVLDRDTVRKSELVLQEEESACYVSYPQPWQDHGINVYYFDSAFVETFITK